MKNMKKFLSLVLVLLLVTACYVPAVSAECAFPAIGVAPVVVPEIAHVIICGVTVVMSGVAALKIAENLGMAWDNTLRGWNQLTSDIGHCLSKAVVYGDWIRVTSEEGKAIMKAVYEYYTATSGDGGPKKDGKWYFEARLNHGEIEINTKRMDETQAMKEMGRGKNIMTLDKKLAKHLVGRFRGLSKQQTDKLKFETHHGGAEGYFLHLHYYVHGMRLHCWRWK